MSIRHEHLAPEELTELAAAGVTDNLAEAREAALACPVCAAELADLERFLARSRDALERATHGGKDAKDDGGELVLRILAQTTRRDSNHAEVVPFTRFVMTRLRASRVLRLAAASLVAHLLALPVLAWYVFDKPEQPAIWVTIAPPTEEAFPAHDDERLPPLVVPQTSVPAMDSVADETLLVSADPEPVRVENSIRLARFQLSRGAPSMPPRTLPVSPDEGPIEDLLRRRAELAAWYEADLPWGVALLGLRQDYSTPLERALAADIQLDAYVLGDRDPERREGLEAALDKLCAGQAPREVRRLEAAALARAEAYGLLDEVQRERLDTERKTASEQKDALGLDLFGTAGDATAYRAAPFGEAWIAALKDALPAEVRERAVARAWMGLGR
jgi:hypothetical protein